MYWAEYSVVEDTLRVKHREGLYCGLWGPQRNRECFDSWTQVRYMGCSIGAEESEGAVNETLG